MKSNEYDSIDPVEVTMVTTEDGKTEFRKKSIASSVYELDDELKKALNSAGEDGSVPGVTSIQEAAISFLANEENSYKDKICLQYLIRLHLDRVKALESLLTNMHEAAQKRYVPEAMENEGITKISIAGVGTVYLQGDMYVSMNSAKKEEAYKWLDDNGNGDLIKPVVNSSSLSALIKKMIGDGFEVPADLINIQPYTKAVIKSK